MPETPANRVPSKEILDEAIAGCRAWLKVYNQTGKPLDCARTHFKLAELCWERMTRVEEGEERGIFLTDALQSIDQALRIFREEAPSSYDEAQRMHSIIEREIYLKDLDKAILGCKALLQVYSQKERPLDWARTHAKLAQLYWDRTTHIEKAEERQRFLSKALQSLDQALPIFDGRAPVSYIEAQSMRRDVEAAREEVSP